MRTNERDQLLLPFDAFGADFGEAAETTQSARTPASNASSAASSTALPGGRSPRDLCARRSGRRCDMHERPPPTRPIGSPESRCRETPLAERSEELAADRAARGDAPMTATRFGAKKRSATRRLRCGRVRRRVPAMSPLQPARAAPRRSPAPFRVSSRSRRPQRRAASRCCRASPRPRIPRCRPHPRRRRAARAAASQCPALGARRQPQTRPQPHAGPTAARSSRQRPIQLP